MILLFEMKFRLKLAIYVGTISLCTSF